MKNEWNLTCDRTCKWHNISHMQLFFFRLFAHSIRDYWSVFKVILRKQQWQTVFLKLFCIMWSLENLFVWKNIHRVFYQRKDCISDNLWWCKNILQICASLVLSTAPRRRLQKELDVLFTIQSVVHHWQDDHIWKTACYDSHVKHWDSWISFWCDMQMERAETLLISLQTLTLKAQIFLRRSSFSFII